MRASFRDPSGSVSLAGGKVLRHVQPEAAGKMEEFLASGAGAQMVRKGQLVSTEKTPSAPPLAPLPGAAQGGVWYEHSRIDFPSYPVEWPPQMLHAAARLTLETARQLLPSGWGLKDATPSNVLFDGAKPVLVDLLSFERRSAGDSQWLAYGQFVRCFLLPLALNRDLGIPIATLMGSNPDGVDPGAAYRWLSPLRRLSAPYRTLVTLPVWLERRAQAGRDRLYATPVAQEAEKARFILDRLLAGLQAQLDRVAPAAARVSRWSGYMEEHSYGAAGLKEKQEFIAEVLDAVKPATVLDAGCNAGHFSLQAAQAGARVVAFDLDETATGMLWTRAQAANLPILPLVANLAHPTPGTGWRNNEQIPLLERLEGRFDLVLGLALLHHLLVTDRVPLEMIIDQFAALTRAHAVIEYVDPGDEMFERIARGRLALHAGFCRESFERVCLARFEILRSLPLRSGKRRLYFLRRKGV